jgi:hypothetical protein
MGTRLRAIVPVETTQVKHHPLLIHHPAKQQVNSALQEHTISKYNLLSKVHHSIQVPHINHNLNKLIQIRHKANMAPVHRHQADTDNTISNLMVNNLNHTLNKQRHMERALRATGNLKVSVNLRTQVSNLHTTLSLHNSFKGSTVSIHHNLHKDSMVNTLLLSHMTIPFLHRPVSQVRMALTHHRLLLL